MTVDTISPSTSQTAAPTYEPWEPDFVLGIDFGATKIALATSDLHASMLESDRLETHAADGAEQAVARALERARVLVATTGRLTGGCCLAVGAVSPGIVFEDHVLLAPNVPGWQQLALAGLLHEGLGLPVADVGTDVKAAALAEVRWGSLRGFDPGVLISLGTGLAAGIVIAGNVIDGANRAAGEIGYLLRSRGDETGAADGRAPLEEYAGGRAIGERGSRLLGATLRAEDVFDLADLRARFLIAETLAELAVHVANLAIALDPARIAVGGGLMHRSELVLAALRHRLRFAAPFPPEVVSARFVHDGPLHGALALALDAATHHQPQRREG